MGGSAFHSLNTPRMPPELYIRTRESTHALLLQHFKYVATPIEAPGKLDHGDLDTVVAEAYQSPDVTPAEGGELSEWLREILKASDVIHDKGSESWNLAIPWPLSSEGPKGKEDQAEREEEREKEKHIQIDVHICPSYTSFTWTLFHAAHGDLWNILRSILSKHSLKATDRGFFLVDDEIEPLNRSRSRTLLTTTPSEVLKFLELDESRYWEQFATPHEMFEYIASCRFFSLLEPPIEEEESKKKKKKPKALNPYKRHLFSLWLEDFLPHLHQLSDSESEPYQRQLPTHSSLLSQVFTSFPDARHPYESNHAQFMLERHLDLVFRVTIKGTVPENTEPQFKAAAIKTLKRIILEGEHEESMTAVPRKNEDGYFDEQAVREFVSAEWETAGKLGMKRQREKAIEGMRKKDEERKRKREKKSNNGG